MSFIEIESGQIKLPPEVIRKLKGKDLQFVEFQDGFLMKPVSQAVKAGGTSGVRNYWLRHACPFSPWPGFMEVTIMHRQ